MLLGLLQTIGCVDALNEEINHNMTGSSHKPCCARMCKVGQRALKSQHTEHASTLSSAALQEYWKVVASLSDDYNS